MKKYDSIIFDLDGVLWDTIDSCFKTLAIIKNKHEDIKYNITSDTIKSIMGKTFDEIKKIYYGYLEDDKATQYTNEAFKANVDNIIENGADLYPSVKETIKKLSENYKLFIVSNCEEGYIESFFKTSGLGKYFKDYECNGKTKLSKGENINLVIERNNLKNSIYVGDTISDKISADYAKIPFIYASYGFGDVKEFDYKIEKLEDLLLVLNK